MMAMLSFFWSLVFVIIFLFVIFLQKHWIFVAICDRLLLLQGQAAAQVLSPAQYMIVNIPTTIMQYLILS